MSICSIYKHRARGGSSSPSDSHARIRYWMQADELDSILSQCVRHESQFARAHLSDSTVVTTPPLIRPYRAADWPALWSILKEAISTGDTFAWAPDSSEAEMHEAWVEAPAMTFVAEGANGRVLGAYMMKPNQPGLGSHVVNAGYCVAVEARGQGLAAAMCEHSQEEARRAGFRSMQFNIVVSTNAPAVHLWKKLGFEIVGVLPEAFRHAQLGYVDAFVMYKRLVM